MKQIEFYPSRGNYRVWDEDEEKWFADFNSARKYLTDNWQNVFTRTLTHTEIRSLQKFGIRVYKEKK